MDVFISSLSDYAQRRESRDLCGHMALRATGKKKIPTMQRALNFDELRRFIHRQRAQQDRVNETENRGVGADAKRNRDNI
jgi:hypothetical protein